MWEPQDLFALGTMAVGVDEATVVSAHSDGRCSWPEGCNGCHYLTGLRTQCLPKDIRRPSELHKAVYAKLDGTTQNAYPSWGTKGENKRIDALQGPCDGWHVLRRASSLWWCDSNVKPSLLGFCVWSPASGFYLECCIVFKKWGIARGRKSLGADLTPLSVYLSPLTGHPMWQDTSLHCCYASSPWWTAPSK